MKNMKKSQFPEFNGYSLRTLADSDWLPVKVNTVGAKTIVYGPIEETDFPEYPTLNLIMEGDVVTEISMELSYLHLGGCLSTKAVNFFNNKAKELELSQISN